MEAAHMKKKIIIILTIILLALLLFPIKIEYKDGGSVAYIPALNTYQVTNYRTLDGLRGTTVRILWFEVYDGSYYLYPKSTDFENIDFSDVTEINLKNCHNGKETNITDSEDINSICTFISSVKGINGWSGRGWSEGSYELIFKDETGNDILALAFGDSDVFFYGDDGEGYPVRYYLDGITLDDVIEFLKIYDIDK